MMKNKFEEEDEISFDDVPSLSEINEKQLNYPDL